MTRTLTTAVALALALAVGAGGSGPASTSNASGACPVTLPDREVLPGAGLTVAGFNYGSGALRAHLHWPNGTLAAGALPDGGVRATVDPGGSISTKLGWWRRVPGKLAIGGRRLDAPAPPLHVHVPDGYGTRGFQPAGLTFPTVGCWRVVGRVGRARLTFVLRVTVLETRSV